MPHKIFSHIQLIGLPDVWTNIWFHESSHQCQGGENFYA